MSVASKKCALRHQTRGLPTTVYRSTDRDPAYRAMEVDSDGAAPPPDDTPRTSLLCAAGMKRAKVDAVRDLLDEDEIETEQDFKRLLGNGRMYAKFETKHEQKLPLNQLTVLETLRDSLNGQSRVIAAGASVATGSAATTGGASAASSAFMPPDPGQFVTPGAPGAPAPAAVPMSASIAPTPPADTAPAGPAAAVPAVPAVAAAVPEFPADIKCAQLSLAATLNIGGVQFRPDWPNCSTDYLQFFVAGVGNTPLSPLQQHGASDHITILEPAASNATFGTIGSWIGDAEYYCAVARLQATDDGKSSLRGVDVLNVSVLRNAHLRKAGKGIFDAISARVRSVPPRTKEAPSTADLIYGNSGWALSMNKEREAPKKVRWLASR